MSVVQRLVCRTLVSSCRRFHQRVQVLDRCAASNQAVKPPGGGAPAECPATINPWGTVEVRKASDQSLKACEVAATDLGAGRTSPPADTA